MLSYEWDDLQIDTEHTVTVTCVNQVHTYYSVLTHHVPSIHSVCLSHHSLILLSCRPPANTLTNTLTIRSLIAHYWVEGR